MASSAFVQALLSTKSVRLTPRRSAAARMSDSCAEVARRLMRRSLLFLDTVAANMSLVLLCAHRMTISRQNSGSLRRTIVRQRGLRLIPEMALLEHLVINQAEMPTEK